MDKNERSRWVQSLVYVGGIFTLLSVYLFLRRGYYNLYIVNKVFGSTAVVVAGLTLLIGPLSKRWSYFTKFMSIRRQLGLLALYVTLAHVVASLAQKSRFAFPSWYLSEWVPILFGVVTIAIWLYMKHISNNEKIQQMGAEVWKYRLSLLGKLGFLALFLHLVIMKYQGWINWFQGKVKQTPELANPGYPPASLFVFFFTVTIIVYRIVNDFVLHRQKIMSGEKIHENR